MEKVTGRTRRGYAVFVVGNYGCSPLPNVFYDDNPYAIFLANVCKRGFMLFRHYKGDIYELLGFAYREDDKELMVVYKPKDGSVWFTRPHREWVERIQYNNCEIARFAPIKD